MVIYLIGLIHMRDELSQTFAALADPTRRALLDRLARGETHVGDLARPFLASMSLPAITKHLQVLERAGLVTKTRDAQWRPCQLNAAPLRDVSSWMEPYRAYWEESLDRLDAYLKTLTQPHKTTPKQPASKSTKGARRGRKKR
jgi:DNA-binding transcriptional ArsR family regulator